MTRQWAPHATKPPCRRTRRNQPLGNLALDLGRLFKSLQCLRPFSLVGFWDVTRMIEVSSSEGVVTRQGNVVDPVAVCGEAVRQSSLHSIPNPNRLVVGPCVDHAGAAPSHTADRPLVAAQDVLCAARVDEPDPAGAVFTDAREAGGPISPDWPQVISTSTSPAT